MAAPYVVSLFACVFAPRKRHACAFCARATRTQTPTHPHTRRVYEDRVRGFAFTLPFFCFFHISFEQLSIFRCVLQTEYMQVTDPIAALDFIASMLLSGVYLNTTIVVSRYSCKYTAVKQQYGSSNMA